MIQLTDWKGEKDFYDPMCGSGTIPLEAAMLASNIPAGYYREQYAFMRWEDFNEELWGNVKQEADSKMIDPECNIFASDRSEKAVGIAKRNLKKAGLHKDIELKVKYFDAVQPESPNGILVFNPPYGKRLEERGEIRDLYKGIGDVLKNNFQGFEGWIISSSFDAMKFIGLRPSRKIHLFNGPLETRFMKFEMYAGSKKEKFKSDEENKDFRKRRSEGKPDWKKESDSKDSSSKPAWKKDDKYRKPFAGRDSEKHGEKRDFGKKKWERDEKPAFDREKKDFGERKWEREEKRSFDRSSDHKDFSKRSDDKPANEQWYGRKPRLGKP
jgi:putative N6-adenine-specific DNA methylase